MAHLIRIIDNKEERNNQFIPLFNALSGMKIGKNNDKYYIVPTEIAIQENSETGMLFNAIQRNSLMQGFNSNCFWYLIDNK